MVEEHSTDFTARIDSDFPNSSFASLPHPACLISDIKSAESASAATAAASSSSSSVDTNLARPSPPIAVEEAKINNCDVDNKLADNKKIVFKSSRPTSIESRRNKSLSIELEEEVGKKDVKKTKSNPLHGEEYIETEKIDSDTKEVEMTIVESASPLKDSRSSLESRSDSPKPGCSSQPDLGKKCTIRL